MQLSALPLRNYHFFIHSRAIKKVALDFLPHLVSLFLHTVVRKSALPLAFLHLVVRKPALLLAFLRSVVRVSATTGDYWGLRKSLTLPQHPVDRTKPSVSAGKQEKQTKGATLNSNRKLHSESLLVYTLHIFPGCITHSSHRSDAVRSYHSTSACGFYSVLTAAR